MNVAFYLAHPVHYHYFKYIAKNIQKSGNRVFFVVKEKDILTNLLDENVETYTIIAHQKKPGLWNAFKSVFLTEFNLISFLRTNRIDFVVGSMFSFATRLFTKTKIINTGEDDAAIIPRFSKLVYPFSHVIVSPRVCNNGRWNKKTVNFDGYMKLGYLHPNHFTPDKSIVERYFSAETPYFILRFAKLTAHHDKGILGISTEVAQHLIDILSPYGRIYISSERALEPQFEQYRIKINPKDMHHVMAFATIYIGDSQSMAVESAILGVPSIRFNSFVGKIGVLKELEDYGLSVGINSSYPEQLYSKVKEILETKNFAEKIQLARARMLNEKVDYVQWLTDFIEKY